MSPAKAGLIHIALATSPITGPDGPIFEKAQRLRPRRDYELAGRFLELEDQANLSTVDALTSRVCCREVLGQTCRTGRAPTGSGLIVQGFNESVQHGVLVNIIEAANGPAGSALIGVRSVVNHTV
jgi:hypothetical protein